LRRLSTAATYFYHDGARYWYSTQPTVTNVIPDLPRANYRVWVRGFGLVDSPKVEARHVACQGSGVKSFLQFIEPGELKRQRVPADFVVDGCFRKAIEYLTHLGPWQ
jgi:hypothetical protein